MNTFRTREKLVALSQVQTGQGIPLVLKDVSLPPPYTDSLPDYQVLFDSPPPRPPKKKLLTKIKITMITLYDIADIWFGR
jgi:hypothetical protein